MTDRMIAKVGVKLLGVLILPALVLAIATSNVEGDEPIEAEPENLGDLIAVLESADVPHALFSTLSAIEQAEVVDYYRVASTETQASDDSAELRASNWCKTQTVDAVRYNAIGAELFTYTSRTKWCFNGTEITKAPAFTRKGKTHVWFWDFVGHIDKSESGGEGDWEHEDFTQGHFRACLTNICEFDEYPDITKWQYGDGSSDYEVNH